LWVTAVRDFLVLEVVQRVDDAREHSAEWTAGNRVGRSQVDVARRRREPITTIASASTVSGSRTKVDRACDRDQIAAASAVDRQRCAR